MWSIWMRYPTRNPGSWWELKSGITPVTSGFDTNQSSRPIEHPNNEEMGLAPGPNTCGDTINNKQDSADTRWAMDWYQM